MPPSRARPGRAILAAALIALLAKAFVLDAAVVEGRSMLPLLRPGSVVLVLRCAYGLRSPFGGEYLLRWGGPREGEVVAAASPRDGGAVVKRVGGVAGGRVFLLGDNPDESVDSRNYGSVPVEDLRGKVLFLPRWATR